MRASLFVYQCFKMFFCIFQDTVGIRNTAKNLIQTRVILNVLGANTPHLISALLVKIIKIMKFALHIVLQISKFFTKIVLTMLYPTRSHTFYAEQF